MHDPKDYYLSYDLLALLEGEPEPPPVIKKIRVYDGRAGGWPKETFPVEFLTSLPSQRANAGNETFSVHHVQPSQHGLRVQQSDSRVHQFAPIDCAIANYFHGY